MSGDQSRDDTDRSVCPACGLEADEMGVLDSGDRVYIHGSGFCYARLEDEYGLLAPAVDHIRAHKEADSDKINEEKLCSRHAKEAWNDHEVDTDTDREESR